MDGDDRRRKQYGQQSYPMSSPTSASPGQQISYQPTERFAQSLQPTSRSESSASSITRPPNLPNYGAYGYSEQQPYAAQAIQGGSLQYQAAYSPGAGRQQQPQTQPQTQQQPQQISPQQYPPYQGMMYNIGQAGPSQLPYDPVPQYQQRQAAAIEVLTNQFGVAQYYSLGEPANSISAGQTPFLASQSESHRYAAQTPVRRPSMQPSYDVEMDYSSMGPPQPQDQQQIVPPSDNMDEAYAGYQQQLKMAFSAISASRLAEAAEEIMNLSRWLLSNVAKLGLHQDEQNPQFEPLQVWRDFNTCWLALGQKQKDLTQEAIRYRIPDPNLLPVVTIQAMVDELIRLCDSIEQHGLVDYDRGVWEEEITNVFSQCLDLLPPDNSSQAEQGYPSARPG